MTFNKKLLIGGLITLAIVVALAVTYQTTIARGNTLATTLGAAQ